MNSTHAVTGFVTAAPRFHGCMVRVSFSPRKKADVFSASPRCSATGLRCGQRKWFLQRNAWLAKCLARRAAQRASVFIFSAHVELLRQPQSRCCELRCCAPVRVRAVGGLNSDGDDNPCKACASLMAKPNGKAWWQRFRASIKLLPSKCIIVSCDCVNYRVCADCCFISPITGHSFPDRS